MYILPKLGRFTIRELTTNQVQVWHDAIPFPIAAIRVAALCWGRVSEILELRRDRGTYLDDGYATIKEHKGKKKAGDKRLEIPPPAAPVLRKLPRDGDNPHHFPAGSGTGP